MKVRYYGSYAWLNTADELHHQLVSHIMHTLYIHILYIALYIRSPTLETLFGQ